MEATLDTLRQRLLTPWLTSHSPGESLRLFEELPDSPPASNFQLPTSEHFDDFLYLLRLIKGTFQNKTPVLLPREYSQDDLLSLDKKNPIKKSPGLPHYALLIPTGGSGGRLRFAIHSWHTLLHAVEGYRQFWGVKRLNAVNLLPLYHVGGLMPCLRTLITGGQLTLGSWKAVSCGDFPVMPGDGDCHLSLVPTQLHRLLEVPGGLDWLRRFTAVLIGGGPADQVLLLHASAQGIPIAPAYGMTEAAGTIALQKPGDYARTKQIRAQALPHWQIRLSPDHEIEIHGAALCHGYHPGGPISRTWFATGDKGLLTPDGYWQVTGRRDRLIVTGGKKADPSLIETALLEAKLCRAAWVTGLDDPHWGQRIAALLEGPPLPTDSVIETLRQHLPSWMIPRTLCWTGALPRNALGKIDKAACLRKLTASP